jgi:hypothetical protein
MGTTIEERGRQMQVGRVNSISLLPKMAHVFRQRQRAARKLLGDKLPSAAMEQDG